MTELTEFKVALEGIPDDDYLQYDKLVKKYYLEYSLSVVKGRAIPDVRDGMKPVHRRILYTMNQLGLKFNTNHKKAARVVGDVIGKYHPHGDTAVYEAAVKMSQDFIMRYPLIDGQGNWGSIDDPDSFAAMRYTECRLESFSDLLLNELGEGTVDFVPNFDGEEFEPSLLPSIIPTPLLNEQFGIAVGMSTDIPSHNLNEVCKASIALFNNPDLTLSGIMKYIKGPDFPGGGQIVSNYDNIKLAYKTGHGKIKVRARWTVEELAKGDWQIVINELPHKVSPKTILEQINEMANPTPKKSRNGASKVNATQLALKQLTLSKVGEIRDDSGIDTDPVRIIIEPKSKRQDPDDLMNFLLSKTSLEANQSINMVFIASDGNPAQMSLLRVLKEWNEFRFQTVTRRTEFRLDKLLKRIHILEGRQIALLDIDKVIKIVRTSDDAQQAKEGIMKAFKLTEVQAEDILAIPLGRLTRMDNIKIETELNDSYAKRDELEHLLTNREAMTDLIINEIKEVMNKIGDKRRTIIKEEDEVKVIENIVDEPTTVILSKKGFIRSRQGHNLDLSQINHKDGDSTFKIIESRTTDTIVLMDTKGRAYSIKVSGIPGGRSTGVPVSSFIDIQSGAKISTMLWNKPSSKLLLSSESGYGFIIKFSDLIGNKKAGKVILKVANTEQMRDPLWIDSEPNVAVINSSGYLAIYPLEEINELSMGKGVKLINLKSDEKFIHMELVDSVLELPPARGQKNYLLEGEEFDSYLRKRGGRGKIIPKKVDLNKIN